MLWWWVVRELKRGRRLSSAQRRLFAHAYFSRMWNLAASERLRRYGTSAAREGELVLVEREGEWGEEEEEEEDEGEEEEKDAAALEWGAGETGEEEVAAEEAKEEPLLGGRGSKRLRGGGGAAEWEAAGACRRRLASAEPGGGPSRRRRLVHEVSAAEASSAAYSAYEVVLPLPGVAVRFPRCEVGRLYRSLLAHDGVDADDVGLEVSASADPSDPASWMPLCGDYRPILLRPRGLRWSTAAAATRAPRRCDDETNADAGAGAESSASDADADTSAAPPAEVSPAPESEKRVDVSVDFDLPPGAYASMALREVSKTVPPPMTGHIRF